jgi:hypothetical protein
MQVFPDTLAAPKVFADIPHMPDKILTTQTFSITI